MGLEVNANHLRANGKGGDGRLLAAASGATTQVWQIEIRDERGRFCAPAD